MKRMRVLVATLFVSPILLNAGWAVAGDPLPSLPGYITQSVIDADVLSNVRGRFVVNMAAGDSNTQANVAAVVLGADGPVIGLVVGIQATDSRQANLPDVATAYIGDRVFANSSGLISVNQTSGVGNAQANGAAIAVGFEEVTADSVLSATTSNAGPSGTGTGKSYQAVSIRDSAFNGAHGLVQVNQSAGSGNSTANNFALQVQLDAKP